MAGDVLARYYSETQSKKILVITLLVYFVSSYGMIKGIQNSSLSWFIILAPALTLLSGLIFGHILFKESLSLGQYIGGGIILTGILTVIFFSIKN
ncbi:hypothetical protein CSB37_00045 [bacterium DOLZORAL124_38_8]|nr:MAG: hypothetical protein CSB37_00045 [bacterium DOLZORAL124_38_8]